jgi:putative glutamine amidotransferase
VNTVHHQAARDVAPGLRVVARAPDDVIEALERVAPHPWVLGVQFHPEWMVGSALRTAIFSRFLQRVREARDA